MKFGANSFAYQLVVIYQERDSVPLPPYYLCSAHRVLYLYTMLLFTKLLCDYLRFASITFTKIRKSVTINKKIKSLSSYHSKFLNSLHINSYSCWLLFNISSFMLYILILFGRCALPTIYK